MTTSNELPLCVSSGELTLACLRSAGSYLEPETADHLLLDIAMFVGPHLLISLVQNSLAPHKTNWQSNES